MAAKSNKADSESRAITNAGVAAILHRYAAVLNAGGEDGFKSKAYRRAAETIERMPGAVADLVARGNDLQNLPGIGKAISSAIEEIVRTGKLQRLDETLAPMPPAMLELISRPLLDPKRVQSIYKKLGIHTLKELAERLELGRDSRVLRRSNGASHSPGPRFAPPNAVAKSRSTGGADRGVPQIDFGRRDGRANRQRAPTPRDRRRLELFDLGRPAP